jgi:IS5 family transposase
MTGPKRNRAPEVAPTRELTQRQMSMESNEKQRQEVIARKAVYDAQRKARKEADAADIKALVSFAKERRIAKEERLAKERLAKEARATAFETLVRNAPFTRPELGERSPEPDSTRHFPQTPPTPW